MVKIVEASVAIIIILGALFVITVKNNSPQGPDYSYDLGKILDEIAANNTIREQIVSSSDPTLAIAMINATLVKRISSQSFGYSVAICDPNVACGLSSYPKSVNGDVYSKDRIISSTLTETYNPKRVKLFLWKVNAA